MMVVVIWVVEYCGVACGKSGGELLVVVGGWGGCDEELPILVKLLVAL